MSQFQRTAKIRLRLRPHPIPEPLRDYTAYYALRGRRGWEQIRRDFLSTAQHRCAACGVARRVLGCHGKWTYNDRLAIATLTNFVILCADCAVATHIAQSIRRGFGGRVIRQLSRVNRISLADAEGLARKALTIWKERNKKSWCLHVAPDLLDHYPQLHELSFQPRAISFRLPPENFPYNPAISRSLPRCLPIVRREFTSGSVRDSLPTELP